MPSIAEAQAAAEVSKWNIEFKDLKPALVTKKDLWKQYTTKNSDWTASMCEMGVSAATAVLTGSGAFNALVWMTGVMTDAAQGNLVDKGLEKGVDYIAGAHMTDYKVGTSEYKLAANKRFATKVASGFLTILVSAAGGALTVATGGSVAIITAIAIIVYIGESKEAAKRDRWDEIVNSMTEKYATIRQKKLEKKNEKHRTELENLVMSNAQHDLEEAGLVKLYTWKSGNQNNTAKYPTSKLRQLLRLMKQIDEGLGKQLRIIDLLEISREFWTETVAYWNAKEKNMDLAKVQPKFDEAKVKAFMRKQIESHDELDELPTTEAETTLAELRKKALEEYGTALKVEKSDVEVWDVSVESSIAGKALPGSGSVTTGRKGLR